MRKIRLKNRLLTAYIIFFFVSISFYAVIDAKEFYRANNNGLTEIEIEGILFMREEEKLARDVYLAFHEMYSSIPIFFNIANSEQKHMDAIKTLIDIYDLVDPILGKDFGEFENQDLQELYFELKAKGAKSLIQALEVGAEIEEIDIIDLKEYIGQTNKEEIIRIYKNLLKGSENHLRAFVKDLRSRGVQYVPKHLSQEDFDDIINKNPRVFLSSKFDVFKGLFNFTFKKRIRNIIFQLLKV